MTASARTGAVAVLLGALLATACGRPDATGLGPFPDAPVVLVSIDTLRSDHLPAYGYDRIQTPAIDRLAEDGILFERAYASYPLTVPSHVTVLSGLLPTEHGVRDNVGYRFDAAKHPYLPRLLQQRGFATGAAVSTWLLRRDTGLGDGFDFYEDGLELKAGVGLGESQRSGAITVERALEWVRQQRGGKFFLFVHLYEPHTPWDPPEPFRSRAAHPYDGEIMAADALLGRLLDGLAAQGDYDRSTVVLLSDHGEGLGDHGEEEHGILLYREALQVPLVVKLPGNRLGGTRASAPAQLSDVAPTLASLAGAPEEGRVTLLDLLPEGAPIRDLYAESYYARLHLGWSELTSLIRGDLHYIEGPDPELYDLGDDPAETRNLLRERRREYAELRDALAPLRRELAAPAEVDTETAQRLAALGYLGGQATTREGPLPDPKASIPALAELDAANRLASARRWDEAVVAFQRVVADHPSMTDAWESLGQALAQLGRHDEAIAAYTKAMELSSGADHVALGLARLHLDRGHFDEAVQHAELALGTNATGAYQVLADIALRREDFPAAERYARAALAARPSHLPALVQIAQATMHQGQLEVAREAISEAEREQARRDPDGAPPGLFLTKGDLMARLGEDAAAVAAFEREIALHPAEPRAYTRLAIVHALAGRSQEAVATLRRLVEGNQTPASYAAAVEALRVLGDPASAGRLLQAALNRFPSDDNLRELATGS